MRRELLMMAFATSLFVSAVPGVAQQTDGGGTKRRAQVMQGRLQMADRASRWWNRPQLAEKVGISEEQKVLLEEVANTSRHDRHAASREFAAVYGRLVDALSEPDVDSTDIVKLQQTLQAAGAAVIAVSADQLVAVREILTAEQWSILRENYPAVLSPERSRVREIGSGSGTTGAPSPPN